MRPVSLTYSGTVASPMQSVFELLADPNRMPEWLPGCSGVTAATNKTGKGARHRVSFRHEGKQIDTEIEIIDFNPPMSYGWIELRRRKGSKTFFALQFQGSATRVTMKHVWTPPSWTGWLLGQFYRRRNAHKMFDGLLQNLRTVLMR